MNNYLSREIIPDNPILLRGTAIYDRIEQSEKRKIFGVTEDCYDVSRFRFLPECNLKNYTR